MPKTLYNIEAGGQILDPNERAVMPGESHEFSDEEIEHGIPAGWSETDPRAGLPAEQAWKATRDAPIDTPTPVVTPTDPPTSDVTPAEPAEQGDKE